MPDGRERGAVAAHGSSVPLNDLNRVPTDLAERIEAAVATVLRSGWYVLGPNVTAFEQEFADYCGTAHCAGVANGTDALELALVALGCGPGDEVITAGNAGLYATIAILATGATPVLADIDAQTMTLCSESVAAAIGGRTRAVVVTHLYGQLAAIEAITAVAASRNVAVVEDCAQAHGARRGGRRAGSFGALGCFSHYPTKNLGALGDGGCVVTNDVGLHDTIVSLRQYGWSSKYQAELPRGRNSRLDEIQAAVLRVKLPLLDGWNAARRAIVAQYPSGAEVRVPMGLDEDYVAHLCVVRSGRRDALRRHLTRLGIRTDLHYPVPDHCQRAVAGRIRCPVSLERTEQAIGEVLTIPCFPELTAAEIDRVREALATFTAT